MEFIKTNDSSNTLYSKKYNQNYHSVKDGAYNESLYKHIVPSFKLLPKDTKHINILDICFGLGYNTFTTILYCINNDIKTNITFYSPELDEELISSLKKFIYPKEFDKIAHIIDAIATNKYYKDKQFQIDIFIGDALDYIGQLKQINIVYQDPFSSDVNQELWTQEYFGSIKKLLAKKAILTTYSIATPIRNNIYQNGLNIYQHILPNNRKSTIATTFKLDNKEFKYIDMEKKLNL